MSVFDSIALRARARTFTLPVILGAVTFAGLLSALLGEGEYWRWFSWGALATPIAVTVYCVFRPSPSEET